MRALETGCCGAGAGVQVLLCKCCSGVGGGAVSRCCGAGAVRGGVLPGAGSEFQVLVQVLRAAGGVLGVGADVQVLFWASVHVLWAQAGAVLSVNAGAVCVGCSVSRYEDM